MKLTALILLATASAAQAAPPKKTECDVAKTARQTIKMIVALADMKGVTAYYGGIKDNDEKTTTLVVEPHYDKSKDVYQVVIRNSDCRVLDVELTEEDVAI